jgi:hypothetical protein
MIETCFADDGDHRHITLDRAGEVEMRTHIAVVEETLVVGHVEIRGERRGIRAR